MCHWLGMLRPALVAHTDALGAGKHFEQNGQRYGRTQPSHVPPRQDIHTPYRCEVRTGQVPYSGSDDRLSR